MNEFSGAANRSAWATAPNDISRMKPLLTTSVILATLATVIACQSAQAREPQKVTKIPVDIAKSQERSFVTLYRASGTVRGKNTAVLTSKTLGYVHSVLVEPGDHVSRGQPVLQLETNDSRATVTRVRASIERASAGKTEAESTHEAALAEVKLAKLLVDREALLLKEAAISQQQFDEAEARYRSALAKEQASLARIREGASTVTEAHAALGEAQTALDYGRIVAPFSGRILERRVDPGVLAAPGTPLLVLADESALRIEVPVEATRADQVRLGDPVDVEIDTISQAVEGKIGEIVPSVDTSSRAFLVKVDLPETVGALRPGTFARVAFHVGVRAKLVVPSSAVSSLGALDRVFVVENDQARLRMVTLGEARGEWTEVLSGLASNESIVTTPPSELRDGSLIEARP